MAIERPARPSQRDVARVAGVSRTTVSLVVNGVAGSNIPQETQDRVWAAVRQLGFRPNQMARGLRSNTSNVLGLITHEIATTPYAVAIIKGAQDTAFARGKTLLIIDTEGAEHATEEASVRMSQWQAEGLIFATDYHRAVEPPAGTAGMPTVLVNCFTADGALSSVVPDERQGGRLATETLVAAGHRRIGLINGPAGFPASEGRLQGYLDVHRAAGIEVDERLITVGDWWQESGVRNAAALLDLDDPPTALFCANDWMAMGAYDIIKERGLRIPADVSVVGFDNRVEIAAHMRPGLSTVALPYYEMGAAAVEYLLDGRGRQAEHRRLSCPLIARGSVAPRNGTGPGGSDGPA